jgi:DNA end-binding protein Ku
VARPIWSGSVNFGLVTVPVELYSATEDHTVHFRQFERGTADRIRYRRVNERTGEEVGYQDIVKGYELSDGEYVLVEPEELEQIAPGKSRTIDIESFVGLDEIDPVYFQKSYWLAPAKEEFARAYRLLLEALKKTNKAGVATFVMRGKEYVAAVRSGDDVLILDTLLFADEIRDPKKELKELKKLPSRQSTRGKELDMAVSLIDSMTEDWNPENYRDTYTAKVHQLIEDKKAGRTVTPEEAEPEEPKVVDLFEALSRSVRNRKSGGNGPEQRRDLSGLSKSELDKMARELDIKGRSKMTRADLEQSIRDATRTSSRRKAS